MRALYATDASVYRELPLAVAHPRHADDLRQLIHFARQTGSSLIPRTAGTSLAGQCVGPGIVVDVSRHLTGILEVNAAEGWVRVQPGVIRNDLNQYLRPHGLFFGPNTSTANRAMIGGMVGNNSCGSYSIVYGTTRDHVIEVKALLSDGSEAVFGPLDAEGFAAKCQLDSLEGQLYRQIRDELSVPETQARIRAHFPKAAIHRRNTGYAVDVLLESNIFTPEGPPFNFSHLLAGSEGTLAFFTEIKIHCDPLPPPVTGLLCAHFKSVPEALRAVPHIMTHQPRAVELMDKIVMDCTKGQKMYEPYRFFVKGDPGAILILEAGGQDRLEVEAALDRLEEGIRAEGYGYHFPRLWGSDMARAWKLREAGLGLLANVPGDAKPVAVIEDTAVTVEELPAYIDEFAAMMRGHGQRAVYYAHAGAGEIHLRPILDLKKAEDRKLFRTIARDTAELVKKYRGSLSGEHGDGRVRAEFIPLMIGEENYALLRRLKQTWDPHNLFNPGKIVDAPPMDVALRYDEGQETRQFDTVFDFSATGGILRAAEKCNGSGDCRKSHLAGGSMCPSFMATRHEKDTTRARANILREILTRSEDENPFAREEIYEVMDLCLSCKGCASECPSNVDVATLKAEFLHQYYKKHGVPLRARAFAQIGQLNRLAGRLPGLSNRLLGGKFTGGLAKKILGIAPQRELPALSPTPLRRWWRREGHKLPVAMPQKGKIFFFVDEFTHYNDAGIGQTAIRLLLKLGYAVELIDHVDSGRAHISKGLLPEARKLAMYNVEAFAGKVSAETPVVGLEPSAILAFRDEYPKLVMPELRETAQALGQHALMVDEFLAREAAAGRLTAEAFTETPRKVLLHGHCHQKALASVTDSATILSLPAGYQVEEIPSGCCGMAGSFGYEAEHYDLSMQVGELVLFPAVRAAEAQTLIAAPGTSCRHQIADGTGRSARHPVEILWEALR
ncbi:MAG: FAD-binding oxidoreductase [Bacteroidetes bacterium]|nr:MAG: FAD-binding oxidoreductase [Bacteroidota bacterium]